MVDSKVTNQRPAYYNLIKLAVEKEAEIHFDEAKKTRDLTSRPKATVYFCFNSKKSMLPAAPTVWMLAPAQVKRVTVAKLYEAMQDDTTVSQGNIETAVRVAQASETFTGQCFR